MVFFDLFWRGWNNEGRLVEQGVAAAAMFLPIVAIILAQANAFKSWNAIGEGDISQGMTIIHGFPFLVDIFHTRDRELVGSAGTFRSRFVPFGLSAICNEEKSEGLVRRHPVFSHKTRRARLVPTHMT